ncbi:hypothetical protein SHXM_06680 [Streptomyces hygroscopicus]|nr:hypothetical protein SHXM_06680 [Streptomyces hygroscopicus]
MCTESRSFAAAPSCTCSTRGSPKNIPYANKIFSQPKYLLVAGAGSGCASHTAARRMNRV